MKLLVVDIGSMFRSVNRKWPKRRLDYNKIWRLMEHDRALAIGYTAGKEAGSFMTVLTKIGYYVDYIRVPSRDGSTQDRLNVSSAVRIAIRVIQYGLNELILCSDDSLLISLITELKGSLVPTHLIGCCPCDALVRASRDHTLITEEQLLPIPEEGLKYPGHVKGQIDAVSEES